MQRWQDEFSKHPIHATLKILKDNASSEQDITDSAREAERARLLKVIGVMERAVADLDPDLAPIDILGALNNHINQSGAITNVQNFASNGNSGHLQDANAQITPALGYVYQLSALRSGRSPRQSDLEAATTSFERFSKVLNDKLIELEGRAAKAVESIDQAASLIREAQTNSAMLSSQFKEKITEWSNQNSEFINTLSKKGLDINRKILADLAMNEPAAFKSLVASLK